MVEYFSDHVLEVDVLDGQTIWKHGSLIVHSKYKTEVNVSPQGEIERLLLRHLEFSER